MDADFSWDDGESPEELAAQFEAFDEALHERLIEAWETLVLLIESTAKKLVPVDTGNLRSSISSDVTVESGTIVGVVGTNVEYSVFIEYGRGAITADPGEVLHFYVDGEEVWTTHVDAAEAQPFLRPSFAAHQSDFKRLVKQAVEDAAQDAGLA